MRGNPLYAKYTVNHIDPIKYSKGFLLNLIAYIDPELLKHYMLLTKKAIIGKFI